MLYSFSKYLLSTYYVPVGIEKWRVGREWYLRTDYTILVEIKALPILINNNQIYIDRYGNG